MIVVFVPISSWWPTLGGAGGAKTATSESCEVITRATLRNSCWQPGPRQGAININLHTGQPFVLSLSLSLSLKKRIVVYLKKTEEEEEV